MLANTVTIQLVRELRQATGASPVNCRRALVESDGDLERAKKWLQNQLITTGSQSRPPALASYQRAGVIETYLHNHRIGVIVELNCQTDFVARTEEFRRLSKNLAQHIVGLAPEYISVEDIPPDLIQTKLAQIGEVKLQNWYKEVVLLEQTFLHDKQITIRELLAQATATFGETISVQRFSRYELPNGSNLSQPSGCRAD